MRAYRHFLPALLLALPLLAAAAPAPPLRILVDTSTAMPMSQFDQGEVSGGIHRDLGLAIAHQLGTSVHLTPMPRKRIPVVLENGDADMSCHYLPAWLPGDFDWTIGFLPNAILIVTGTQWPAPASMDALRGAPIGTVLGFAYPEVQHALGNGFIRDDAADALQNLTKLATGRTRHALTGEVFFSYQQRLHPNLLQVHRPLLVTRIEAQCAVTRKGRYSVGRINRAIRALQKNGQIDAIYRRYR